MPRNKALRSSCLFPKDLKVNVPYIEEFGNLILAAKEILSTRDIYIEYCSFLAAKTAETQSRGAGASFIRFARDFKTLAIAKGWHHCTTDRFRGYRVQIYRVNTRKDFGHVNTNQTNEDQINAFLAKTDGAPFRRLFISKEKSYGAVSIETIGKNTVICEYLGQQVSREEGEKRELEYGKVGVPCTMFNISNSMCFDGQRDCDGRLLAEGENLGAVLNHSHKYPNCKIIKTVRNENVRLFVKTIHEIAPGVELLYDYQDRRRGVVPQWMYE